MLFYLEDDIINEINDETILALQNIAECIKEGRHIILASRELLKKLSAMDELSQLNKRIFYRRAQEMTQYGALLSSVGSYVRVSGSQETVTVDRRGDHTCFLIPLKLLSNSENLQPTILVCEDIMDCEFYRSMTKFCMNRYGLSGDICFTNVNGGGANTYRNYEYKLRTSFSPCLAIVDSDRNRLGGEIGTTAKNVDRVFSEYCDNKITFRYILDVREKENLIPPEVYNEVERDGEAREEYEILEEICDKGHKDLYFFWDIKGGHLEKTSDLEEAILQILGQETEITFSDLEIAAEYYKRSFGEEFPLCRLVEKINRLSVDEENALIIHGIRHAFERFKVEVLELNTIKKKKKAYESHRTETLKKEIEELEERLNHVMAVIQNSVKDEFETYWRHIAVMCYEWGCSAKTRLS